MQSDSIKPHPGEQWMSNRNMQGRSQLQQPSHTHTHTRTHRYPVTANGNNLPTSCSLLNWVVCSCLRLEPVNQFDTICASLRLRLLWPRVSSNLHQSLAQWALVKIGKQNSPSGPAWARQLRPKMIYERNFDNQLRFLFLFFIALLFQKAPKWKSNFEVHFHCTLWNSFMPWQRRRS